MEAEGQRKKRKTQYVFLAVIVLLLVILVFMFLQLYGNLRRTPFVGYRGSILSVIRNRGAVSAQDVSFIQTWMTFDYINRMFDLPPSYLQSLLSIADSQYPRLTIEEYAERQHISKQTLLAEVQQAVAAYAGQSQ